MRLAGTCWNGPGPIDCVLGTALDLNVVDAPPSAAEGRLCVVLLGFCDDVGVGCSWPLVGSEVWVGAVEALWWDSAGVCDGPLAGVWAGLWIVDVPLEALDLWAGFLAGGCSVADTLGGAGVAWGLPNLGTYTDLFGCAAFFDFPACCVLATLLLPQPSCLPGTIWSLLFMSGVADLFAPTCVREVSFTVLPSAADGVTDFAGMHTCLRTPNIADDAHCSWLFGMKHFVANESRQPPMEGRRWKASDRNEVAILLLSRVGKEWGGHFRTHEPG